ncbi:hypothetical protein EDB89DRAFT_2001738 [Lactarius sanguifluus]|nr:hypothetical protein EDB89DRAFT_2001738 [Lactarius sanguifluus]
MPPIWFPLTFPYCLASHSCHYFPLLYLLCDRLGSRAQQRARKGHRFVYCCPHPSPHPHFSGSLLRSAAELPSCIGVNPRFRVGVELPTRLGPHQLVATPCPSRGWEVHRFTVDPPLLI